jgi:hypothetical protein
MFRLFKPKHADRIETAGGDPPKSFFPSWRHQVEFTNSVTHIVDVAFKDRASFKALGGSVYALQQDMQALGTNLWNAHVLMRRLFAEANIVLPAVSAQPLSEQLPHLLETLNRIIEINGDYCRQNTDDQGQPVAPLDPNQSRGDVLLAGLRNKAASIWLLTILPPAQGGNPLAASNIWLRLAVIPLPQLRDAADAFTGSYFNGVRARQFSASAWPFLIA